LLLSKADEGKDYLKRRDRRPRGIGGRHCGIKAARSSTGTRDSLSDAIDAGKQAYREKVDQATSQPV